MCPRVLRFAVVAALVCAFIAAPRRAEAIGDGPAFDPTAGLAIIVIVGEMIIPDVRFEVPITEHAQPGLVLSWPIVFEAWSWGKHTHVLPFVEMQHRMGKRNFRALAGARLLLAVRPKRSHTVVLLEAAGITGSDGDGAMMGAGIGRRYGQTSTFCVVVRGTRTQHGWRTDVAMDFQLPL